MPLPAINSNFIHCTDSLEPTPKNRERCDALQKHLLHKSSPGDSTVPGLLVLPRIRPFHDLQQPAPKVAAVSPVLRAIYGANTDLCICISFKRPSTTSTNDARKPQPPSQCSKPDPQPRFEAIPGVSILSREELQKSLPVEEDLILVLPANVQKSVQTIYLTGVTLRIQIYKY